MTGGTAAAANSSRAWRHPAVWLFAALLALPVPAHFGANAYILSFATHAVALGLAALSLDLMLGIGALASFGHAAYLGIGAYSVAILSDMGQEDLLVQIPVAIAVASVFAGITGFVSLRASGVYYIMSTLAFGQMLYFLAQSLSAYGGDDGVTLAARSRLAGSHLLASDLGLYYVTLAALIAAYVLLDRIVGSRFGRVLGAVRQNPMRVRAVGLDPFRYRLLASILAGSLCAVAGVLLANQSEFVSPAFMTWQRSGELLVMVVLGGMGRLWGAVLGAICFLTLEEVLPGLTDNWKMVLGALLILAALGRDSRLGQLLKRAGR